MKFSKNKLIVSTFCLIDCHRTAFASIICQMSVYPVNLYIPTKKGVLKEEGDGYSAEGVELTRSPNCTHESGVARRPDKRRVYVYVRDSLLHLTLLAVARCRRRRASPGPQLTSQTHAPTSRTACLFPFAVTRARRPSLRAGRAGPDHPGVFTAAALSLLRGLDLWVGWIDGRAEHPSSTAHLFGRAFKTRRRQCVYRRNAYKHRTHIYKLSNLAISYNLELHLYFY